MSDTFYRYTSNGYGDSLENAFSAAVGGIRRENPQVLGRTDYTCGVRVEPVDHDDIPFLATVQVGHSVDIERFTQFGPEQAALVTGNLPERQVGEELAAVFDPEWIEAD